MLVGNGMSKIANAMVIEFHVRGINQDMYKLIWYKILKLKKNYIISGLNYVIINIIIIKNLHSF